METIEFLVITAADTNVALAKRLAAFGRLVLRFQDMAYGCAYALLGNFHLAEDAAQEAFLTAYRRLGQLRQPGAFPGWFRRIVLSQCSRLTRRFGCADVRKSRKSSWTEITGRILDHKCQKD